MNHCVSSFCSTRAPDLQERPFSSTCSSARTVWSTGSQFTTAWITHTHTHAMKTSTQTHLDVINRPQSYFNVIRHIQKASIKLSSFQHIHFLPIVSCLNPLCSCQGPEPITLLLSKENQNKTLLCKGHPYLFLICQSCLEELNKQILRPPVVLWKTRGHFLSGQKKPGPGQQQVSAKTLCLRLISQIYSPGPSWSKGQGCPAAPAWTGCYWGEGTQQQD